MDKDGLTENIRRGLNSKRTAKTLKQVDRADRNLLKVFKNIEATVKEAKDVGFALEVFGTILNDTKKHHINDKEMGHSIDNAILELEGAQNIFSKVHSSRDYECIAKAEATPRNTVEGRPNDLVRQFITAHSARLRNECKGFSRDAYKGFLNAQRSCLNTAKKEYIKLQDKAMGREPEIKKKSRGMER